MIYYIIVSYFFRKNEFRKIPNLCDFSKLSIRLGGDGEGLVSVVIRRCSRAGGGGRNPPGWENTGWRRRLGVHEKFGHFKIHRF